MRALFNTGPPVDFVVDVLVPVEGFGIILCNFIAIPVLPAILSLPVKNAYNYYHYTTLYNDDVIMMS